MHSELRYILLVLAIVPDQ